MWQRRSSNLKPEVSKSLLNVDYQEVGMSPLDELQLMYYPSNQQDKDELVDILKNKLSYPSVQIAEQHNKANRMGCYDKKIKVSQQDALQKAFQDLIKEAEYCFCCGCLVQNSRLSICTGFDDINQTGVSTYLFFQTLQNLIFLLILMFLIMGIYSLKTNIAAYYQMTKNFPEFLQKWGGILQLVEISLGSKFFQETQDDKKSYLIQCWLGVGIIALWIICFALIKRRQIKAQNKVDLESKTAGDFTISISNYPKNLIKEDFQKQLNVYRQKCQKILTMDKK